MGWGAERMVCWQGWRWYCWVWWVPVVSPSPAKSKLGSAAVCQCLATRCWSGSHRLEAGAFGHQAGQFCMVSSAKTAIWLSVWLGAPCALLPRPATPCLSCHPHLQTCTSQTLHPQGQQAFQYVHPSPQRKCTVYLEIFPPKRPRGGTQVLAKAS